MNKLLSNENTVAEVQLCCIRTITDSTAQEYALQLDCDIHPTIAAPIQEVLDQYHMVFQKPQGLPPQRAYYQNIMPKEGTNPIKLRPYRYNSFQKDGVEKLVQEFLNNGVIQLSHSPMLHP